MAEKEKKPPSIINKYPFNKIYDQPHQALASASPFTPVVILRSLLLLKMIASYFFCRELVVRRKENIFQPLLLLHLSSIVLSLIEMQTFVLTSSFSGFYAAFKNWIHLLNKPNCPIFANGCRKKGCDVRFSILATAWRC